jgi:hypothetical protein
LGANKLGLGTGATAAIVGGIGAAGSIASGVIGSNAAGHAADTQAAAANNAAALERQSATDALNFNKLQYGNSLSLLSPFYNTGVSANSRLAYLMGLNPSRGLPAGVVNPNAPASTNQVAGGGGQFLRNTGPNGTPGDAVLPVNAGGRPGIINESAFSGQAPMNSFSALSGQAPFQGSSTTGIGGQTGAPVGLPGAPGSSFGPAQFTGDPNDPSGGGALQGPNAGLGINPAGSTGDPSPFGPGGMGDITNAGGVTNASTNQGGTGQIPRTDGGSADSLSGTDGSFGSLSQGWNKTFQSPTNLTDDPGYNFRLTQGNKALENSAAARGGLFSGGTAKALTDYNQGSASQEYQNTYNRALQNYDTNYNTFTGDQTNQFNRLMALMTGGQTSANQLSASGLTAANNAANIGLTSAGQIGQQLNNAGAANASGYVGSANAINGAISGGTNTLQQLAMLLASRNG